MTSVRKHAAVINGNDPACRTGVLEVLLQAAQLPRGREWLLSGHSVSTAGDRSGGTSSSCLPDGIGSCIAERYADAPQLQKDSSGLGLRRPAQCGCGVCQLACQAAAMADLLLSLAARGGSGTHGPTSSGPRPLAGFTGMAEGDHGPGGSSNGGAAAGLGEDKTSLAACVQLISATLASALVLPLPLPPRHEANTNSSSITVNTIHPAGEPGGGTLSLRPAAGWGKQSATVGRWRQHGPAVAAWVAASRGRPLLSLLHLHAALSLTHSGPGNVAQGQATSAGTPAAAGARVAPGRRGSGSSGSRGSRHEAQGSCCTCCCCVSKMVLAAVEVVCDTAPAAVAAEVAAGQLGERSVRGESEREQLCVTASHCAHKCPCSRCIEEASITPIWSAHRHSLFLLICRSGRYPVRCYRLLYTRLPM